MKPTTLIDKLYSLSFRNRAITNWRSNAGLRQKLSSANRFVLDDSMTNNEAAAAILLYVPGYRSPYVNMIENKEMTDPRKYSQQELEKLFLGYKGLLHTVWVLLATINDLPILGREVTQAKGFLGQGRIRPYLTHRTITLNVPQDEYRKVARKALAIARRRAHKVRGHWRDDWRFPGQRNCTHLFGIDQRCQHCGKHRIWIGEHMRGDASLGLIEHDYKVTHDS